MNKKLIAGGGAILLIIVALSVYFLFFYKNGSSNGNGKEGKLTDVFDDFFKRMDEKYTIKSNKAAIQMLELVVGNSLKVAEEFLELPDIKWALENQLFDGVNIPNINNAISPVFDCMANKVKAVGQDQTLIDQWNAFDVDTNGLDGSEPVFVLGMASRFNGDMMSCFQSEITDERISAFRTEYNKIIGNVNEANDTQIEMMSADVTAQTLQNMVQNTTNSDSTSSVI